MVPFLGPVFQLKWDGICGGGVSLSNFYMRCSRKARSLLPLSPVGEVAHFAIRANLHIDALTMLKDAWQSIVGRCAVFLFRVFRLLLQTYDIILNDMFPRVCFPQAPLSKILSIAADLFLQSQHLSKGNFTGTKRSKECVLSRRMNCN